MNRKILTVILALATLLIWTVAAVRIANAEDGREPGDPRSPTFHGSYTGRTVGPWIGANSWGFNGPGISIGKPSDDSMIDWKALHLKRLAEVAETKLENIEFAFDKSNIEQQYETDLDFVSRLLIENPEISLSLGGHTDAVGSDEYNGRLADHRADAVYNALVERGVSAARLTAVGFGETHLLEDILTPSRKNRRVEVGVTVELPVYID